ncbi:hypothetical protein ACJX0J_026870, partial [Zea mays]
TAAAYSCILRGAGRNHSRGRRWPGVLVGARGNRQAGVLRRRGGDVQPGGAAARVGRDAGAWRGRQHVQGGHGDGVHRDGEADARPVGGRGGGRRVRAARRGAGAGAAPQRSGAAGLLPGQGGAAAGVRLLPKRKPLLPRARVEAVQQGQATALDIVHEDRRGRCGGAGAPPPVEHRPRQPEALQRPPRPRLRVVSHRLRPAADAATLQRRAPLLELPVLPRPR